MNILFRVDGCCYATIAAVGCCQLNVAAKMALSFSKRPLNCYHPILTRVMIESISVCRSEIALMSRDV